MPPLEDKIRNKSARIGIIGLGYVGLPLAVAFARKDYKVLGFDIQQKRVDSVNRGLSYVPDVSSKVLSSVANNLEATTHQDRLQEVDVACICVPTPLTRCKEPDLSYVIRESQEIAKYLKPQRLVVLESTTYPGTTREVVLPILERSGLKHGVDFFLAYSPERVDPGSKKYNLSNTPKIVGGITPESANLAAVLYGQITSAVVLVTSTEVAEMTKVFENVFRSVNIALVNEVAQLCEKMGISVWEVISAAATKPFGYIPFQPGPGVGGHCIPINPYYLVSKAREYDFHTRFIELATEINERMPYHIVSRVMEILNVQNKSLSGAKVLVLGVAYKKDVGDVRESPSLKLVQLFQEKGALVSYHDPHVPQIQLPHGNLSSVDLTEDYLRSVDCTVIATDHSSYNLEQIVDASAIVFDTRGATKGLNRANVIRLGE